MYQLKHTSLNRCVLQRPNIDQLRLVAHLAHLKAWSDVISPGLHASIDRSRSASVAHSSVASYTDDNSVYIKDL